MSGIRTTNVSRDMSFARYVCYRYICLFVFM